MSSATMPTATAAGAGPSNNIVSFSNGLVDLDALMAGAPLSDVLLPHTPNWFNLNALPYPFDPAADCPRWLSTLTVNQEGDAERLAILQEWAGYLLLPDSSEQKFLILEGEGNNGKSVYMGGIEAMLGLENVSHVPLEHFAHRFALTSTLHKLANIAADCGDLDKVAEGFLKSFTSGDRMMFDRKNKPAIEATPTARLMLATNNRPRFSDRSGGLWRRMILVPWRRAVPASERIKGMDKPEWWQASGELPGMFMWAVAGLSRLRERGGFTESELCKAGVEQYRDEVNPTRKFLADHVKVVDECHSPCRELYAYYAAWCKEFGFQKTNEVNFGKEVFRHFPTAKRERKMEHGERFWRYTGIEYRADDDEQRKVF